MLRATCRDPRRNRPAGASEEAWIVERWRDVEPFLREQAERDLHRSGEVRPCLAAFADHRPLLVAFLRAFEKGRHGPPLIEILALALPLGANRLAFSISGRAWSLKDPLPPVLEGVGDLRQRVLVMTFVQDHRQPMRSRSVLIPFDHDQQGVAWGATQTTRDASGWLTETLREALRARRRLRGPTAEIRRQAARCALLGHDVFLAPEVVRRLGLPSRPPGAGS